MTQKAKYIFLLLLACNLFAEQQVQKKAPEEKDASGFKTEDSYIDVNEAVRSRQYVRRAVLSSIVQGTSNFSFGRPYINHLMGFSAVIHRGTQDFTKYVSGLQGLSVGYVLNNGLAFEGGVEFSALSNAFVGLRYIYRPEKLTLWPFTGFGVGTAVSSLNFADGPPEAKTYSGPQQMGFFTLGFLVPVVDVGIKAEVRGLFYGMSRLALCPGIGVIVFL